MGFSFPSEEFTVKMTHLRSTRKKKGFASLMPRKRQKWRVSLRQDHGFLKSAVFARSQKKGSGVAPPPPTRPAITSTAAMMTARPPSVPKLLQHPYFWSIAFGRRSTKITLHSENILRARERKNDWGIIFWGMARNCCNRLREITLGE